MSDSCEQALATTLTSKRHFGLNGGITLNPYIRADRSNTNVVKLFELLDKSDTSKQVCYYQPGVGTCPSSAFAPSRY